MSENATQTQAQTAPAAPEAAPDPIKFTDACVAKVKELLAEDGNAGMMLRVFVQGGGCQGFQYGFQFEEKPGEDDTEIVRDGVTFLVDSLSFQYLVGAEIDYKDDLEGSQFVIRNPNAEKDEPQEQVVFLGLKSLFRAGFVPAQCKPVRFSCVGARKQHGFFFFRSAL